jgi:hypothetical protein
MMRRNNKAAQRLLLAIAILSSFSAKLHAELAWAGAGATQCSYLNQVAIPGRGSDQSLNTMALSR